MTDKDKNILLEQILEQIELPTSAYQTAIKRYEDIGEWLGREGSTLEFNDVHVFAQGSFRLGTAIKPINPDEEYDLDLACKLRSGITKLSHSQKDLKTMVGNELELYRKARNIEKKLDEKHRCWTLEYKDSLSFHMDIVPAIPLKEDQRNNIKASLLNQQILSEGHIDDIVAEGLSITDNRNDYYEVIKPEEWNISNPEGYTKWFEMNMFEVGGMKITLEKAQVDYVPLYKQKSTLQKVIQLLKRHRDTMYNNPAINDCKPISIIITTLATLAYQNESDLTKALMNILNTMGNYINYNTPRIPNPVNPNEDFSDKWSMPQYSHLNLEKNFYEWLEQAQNDFNALFNSDDSSSLSDLINESLELRISDDTLSKAIGLSLSGVTLKAHDYDIDTSNVAKPWKK